MSDDLIRRSDAEMIFQNARQELFEHREKYSPEEFNTRDLMLLNAEQFIHLLPSVKPQEPKGHWIMRHRKVNTINYRTGEDVLTGEIHTVKELIRYETDEPYCACCGKRAEDISQDYCGYCGARMEVKKDG